MRENKNTFIIFALIFCSIMMVLLTTEKYNKPMTLPNRRIDYISDDSDASFDMTSIFNKDEVAEFAYEMFEFQGIRSGIVDIATTGFTKEDLGVENSVVNFTEVVLEDGTIVSFIEPESEAVSMYNKITSEGLLVVIIEDINGTKQIIQPGDENFEIYKQALLREKRSIQTTKLTNLELLLSESRLIGKYDAYLGSEDNLIRSSQVYYNEKKNYMLMLSKDKLGVEYFLVDAGVDMYFDHIYEFSSEFLEVKGFVTANELEHLLYGSYIKMIEMNTFYLETKFKGEILIIKRNEENGNEE
ncbi:MAG: hypothetical protein JEZ08_23225 [Clostridiales bacterium]|nr:hypothetical protein [Clostridiales bacterium]